MSRRTLALAVAAALTAAPAWALPPQGGTTDLAGTVASGAGPGGRPLGGVGVAVYAVADPSYQLLASTRSGPDGTFRVTLGPEASGRVLFATAREGATELVTLLGTDIPAKVTIDEMTTVASAYALARLFRNGHLQAEPQAPIEVAVGMAHDLVSAVTGLPSDVMTKSPNADETNAWRLLGTLSNMLAPCVRGNGEACDALFARTTTSGGGAPQTTFEAMLSIARHPASNLRPLFTLGEQMNAYAPSLTASQGPDATDPLTHLDAFTLAIKFNASGRVDASGKEICPFGGPANVAFDTNGYLWITNNVVQGTPNSSNCMIVLKPDGSPADGTGGTPASPVLGGGIVGQGFGLGFNPSGTLWASNFGWGTVEPTDAAGKEGGSVSRFAADGTPLSPSYGYTGSLYKVQGTVSDQQGNIWMASFGNDLLQIFPGGNPAAALPAYQDDNTLPFDIRLDSAGDAWVSYNGTRVVSKFTLDAGRLERDFTVAVGRPPGPGSNPTHITGGPRGLAVDAKGNAWVSDGDGDAIYAISQTGEVLGRFKGGGLYGPWGVSLDSDQTVWVANFGPLGPAARTFSVSQLCGALTARCPAGLALGDPISPASGYTLPSGGAEVHLHNGQPLYDPLPAPSYRPLMRLTSANVDMAGNVWCANNWKPAFAVDSTTNPGGDGMIVFVGLAAPVLPVPYSAPPVSPF